MLVEAFAEDPFAAEIGAEEVDVLRPVGVVRAGEGVVVDLETTPPRRLSLGVGSACLEQRG